MQFLSSLPQHSVQGAAVRFTNLPGHRDVRAAALTLLGHCQQDPGLGFTAGALQVQQIGHQLQDGVWFQVLFQPGVLTQDLRRRESL